MGKMKANVFVEKAVEIAKNFKTLYVMGCFGAPLTGSNVSRYCNNHSYNRAADRTAMIKAAGNQNPPVYGFDCVCLIKGILWGWSGNASKTYGGANYASNGVPDIGADTMITRCLDVSATGWANMAVGEAVWMSGHIGIYIGDGLAVECSPKWENKVQITAVGNIGSKAGYNTRTWTKHGKLPYVDYSESGTTTGGGTATKPDTGGATIYKVAAGDNLSKIAAKYGTTVDALAEINAIKNKNLIRVGQVLMLQDTPQAAADKLEALGVINSPDYWAEAAEAGKVQYLDILLKKAAQTITKAGVRTDTPQEGVAALVAAGVINTPEYWLANYDIPQPGPAAAGAGRGCEIIGGGHIHGKHYAVHSPGGVRHPAGGPDPDRDHQHHHPGGQENHLGQDPHQHSGGAGGHGRDPAGVLCGVPDHGLGRHLVHGGRRGGPGPVRELCGHVRL